ncbi:hypothetical protein T484DRAFT_1857917 [Baffinella frigidus]|nr:hypothetical protein T484DRAFT_1857917 [Cryptophyta sp. CCMP2293]
MLLLLAAPLSSSFHLSTSLLPHSSNTLLPPSSLSLPPSPVFFLRTALPSRAATPPSPVPRRGRAIAWRAAADGTESSEKKEGGFFSNLTRLTRTQGLGMMGCVVGLLFGAWAIFSAASLATA